MQLCGVCCDQVPKYKCPVCQIRYCSVSCFKQHKNEDSCHKQKDSPTTSSRDTVTSSLNSADQPWSLDLQLDEGEETDRVPLHRLKQLDESAALKVQLRNPHLRRLMMEVDAAEDKAAAMKTVMQEPLFVEFTDLCLGIIQPQ